MKIYRYIANKLKITLMVLLLMPLLACNYQSENANKFKEEQTVEVTEQQAVIPCTPDICFIYYDSFLLHRVFGLNEETIEGYGHKSDFDESGLEQIIDSKVQYDLSYRDVGIKAKIVLHDDIYYVEHDGYMRSGSTYYKVSIPKLMAIMGEEYVEYDRYMKSNDEYYKINIPKLIAMIG